MLRSLFIGFLILSSLTAKGTEAQIAVNTNSMPAGAPTGFFGTMPGQMGKTAGIVSTGARKVFFSCDTIDNMADGLLSGMVNNNAIPAWFEDNYRPDYQSRCAEVLPGQVCACTDAAFYCVSGLSPPYFRIANDTIILSGF